MAKLKYFLKEALNSLWQYRVRNVFSIAIICMSFLIVGIFLALSNNLQFLARELSENMNVVVFLSRDVPPAARQNILGTIKSSPDVAEVKEVSPEEAQDRLRRKFPELREVLRDIGPTPFPPSIEATLKKQGKDQSGIVRFVDRLRAMPGVADIQYNRDWVERMQSLSRLARAVGFFLGGILVLASFFIISNVVKLNVIARRNEVEILRMVGGTNTFIRIPFLMEGITLGVLGGLLSLALLGILIGLFPFYLGRSLGALRDIVNFRSLSFGQSLSLIFGGGVMGFLGSLTSLQRFLKI
jgi:cell division transport system permease protein